MPPKRSPAPSTTPASAVASGIKPSTAASSQSTTQSPLKRNTNTTSTSSSYTSTSATTSSSTTQSAGSSGITNRNAQTSASSSSPSTPAKTSTTSTSAKKSVARSTSNSNDGAVAALGDAGQVVQGMWERYVKETPQRVKLVDSFMAFLVTLGVIQFVYCVIAGNYPFNAFLSGFSATVGQFVLTASLRMQTNPSNKSEFPSGFSDERAFADYVFGSLILHFFCVNFIN